MDLQTGVICGGIAIFSAIVIYVITVFSMKEKTYEEAIAEQRKMPEENLLLGRSTKDKTKDKKLKKLGKKVKEKSAEPEKSDQNEVQKASAVQPSKVHVDFEEPEAEVVSEHPPQDDKKKKKKEKVKPILLNKDEPSVMDNEPQMPTNHFEEIMPKDDLLQKRSRSMSLEDSVVKSNPEPATQEVVKPQPSTKTNHKSTENAVTGAAGKQEKEKVPTPKAEHGKAAQKEVEKEKVKEKAEKSPGGKVEKNEKTTATKQEKQPTPKPEKAAKPEKPSKTEKAVAEKAEKIVAPVVVPSPKAEKIEKREKSIEKKAEKSVAAKGEKPVNAKSDKASGKNSEKNIEKAAVKQSVQETSAANVKATPSVASSGTSAAPPVAPVANPTPVVAGAPEGSAATVPVQAKEKNRKKKSELAVLQQMSGERDGVNVSLLLPLVQKAALSRSESQTLIDFLLNKQLNAGETDSEWIEGRADPVAKLRRQLAERERQLAQEQEATKGVHAKLKELRSELNSEKGQRSRASAGVRRLEEALQAKTTEAQTLTAQLQQVQHKLQEEHSRLRQAQEQVQQNEEGLQEQLQLQRQQAEMHIAHLQEQEGTLKTQVQQVRQQLADQEQAQKQLQMDLQQQRDQALAEKNLLLERGQELARQVEEASEEARLEEQAGTKELLLRIFPQVEVEDCKSHDQWLEKFESAVAKYLEELQSRPVEVSAPQPSQTPPPVDQSDELLELGKQNTHLQGVVANYKTIIDDTSGMLQKLQSEVEEREVRWRQQMQVKEEELEAMRQELAAVPPTTEPSDASPVTQSNLEDLKEELQVIQQQKQDLEEKLKTVDGFLESLQEEKGSLVTQLRQEQTQTQELSKELVKMRSLVQIGKDSLSQEHEKGVHQNHNGSSNGPASETSPVSQGGSGKK